MFTRIHSFKFQNEFAKESVKKNLKSLGDTFVHEGLLIQIFVDIDKNNLYMINSWENATASEKAFSKHKETVFGQVKEMGVKVAIEGGDSEIRFSDLKILEQFTKVWNLFWVVTFRIMLMNS